MPYEGTRGPDTGQSHSAQLSNLEHRFKRELDHQQHVRVVLHSELDRAHARLREYAAAESPEEFDAEDQRQTETSARIARGYAKLGVRP